MGNYSYLVDYGGCVIDSDKLKVTAKLVGNSYVEDVEQDSLKLRDDNLGEFLDGWKIQGYWYEEFGRFLHLCAAHMKGLSDKREDNFVEMEEEQGFKFCIFFYLENGEPVVEVDYVPMETRTFRIDKDGKQTGG